MAKFPRLSGIKKNSAQNDVAAEGALQDDVVGDDVEASARPEKKAKKAPAFPKKLAMPKISFGKKSASKHAPEGSKETANEDDAPNADELKSKIAADFAKNFSQARAKQNKAGKLKRVKNRSCYVLMIGDEGAILTHVKKGRVERRMYAASSEPQHMGPILERMQKTPKIPFYILCDMIDQSYVRHTLPPVSALNINKLVNRRLKRDFAPEDIKGSISLGRDSKGKKEWNYLLIALANTTTLQQWMDPLLELDNRCLGLYLLPVEAQGFAKDLGVASIAETETVAQWQILATHDKVSGMRHVVLQNGNLIFTRLNQYPPDISTEVLAGNVEQEMLNTIEYLRRMEFDEKDGLDIFLVMAQEICELIDLKKAGALHTKILSPFDTSKLLALPQAALASDRYADVLLSSNFGMRQKPRLKLFTAYGKKLDTLYQTQIGMTALGALAALYLCFSGASAVFAWQQALSERQKIENQIVEAKNDLSKVKLQFSKLGDNQSDVLRISGLFDQTLKKRYDPLNFILKLSKAQEDSFLVENWSWNIDPLMAMAAEQPTGAGEIDPLRIEASIKILNHKNDRRILAAKIETLFKEIEKEFPRHKVARMDSLVKMQQEEEQDALVIDLNRSAESISYALNPGEENILLMLSGPIELEDPGA